MVFARVFPSYLRVEENSAAQFYRKEPRLARSTLTKKPSFEMPTHAAAPPSELRSLAPGVKTRSTPDSDTRMRVDASLSGEKDNNETEAPGRLLLLVHHRFFHARPWCDSFQTWFE